METLYQTVGKNGISIPLEIVQGYGLREGSNIRIQLGRTGIHVVPANAGIEEIEKRALRYVLVHVGDAAEIVAPKMTAGGDWEVVVVAPKSDQPLGHLYFNAAGDLLRADESLIDDPVGANDVA